MAALHPENQTILAEKYKAETERQKPVIKGRRRLILWGKL